MWIDFHPPLINGRNTRKQQNKHIPSTYFHIHCRRRMLSSVHQHFEFEPKERFVFIKCIYKNQLQRYSWNTIYGYLGVCTLLLFALAASEQVSLGAPRSGHLVIPDGLFGQILTHLLQLIACHFLLDLDFHTVTSERTCSYNDHKMAKWISYRVTVSSPPLSFSLCGLGSHSHTARSFSGWGSLHPWDWRFGFVRDSYISYQYFWTPKKYVQVGQGNACKM